MKKIFVIAGMVLSPLAAYAQMVPAIDHTASISPGFMENPEVTLSDKEKKALEFSEKWKKNPEKPRRGENGSVTYLYGATLPTLICATLEICAIRLQKGEVVNNVNVGDVRWKFEPSVVGQKGTPNAITYVIVKPLEPGLTTSTIITTDRRSYTIKLVSTKNKGVSEINFDYPEDTAQAWDEYRAAQAKHAYATTLPTGQSIEKLDFGFRMSGDSPKWKPKRVYTDGVKTYIQFPSSSLADEAPALVALQGGGLFSDPEKQIVNYRLAGDRFVVDQVLERAALISGVGRDQIRVTIERAEAE